MIRSNGQFVITTENVPDQILTKKSKLSILNFNPANSGTYECRAVIGRQKTSSKFDIALENGKY